MGCSHFSPLPGSGPRGGNREEEREARQRGERERKEEGIPLRSKLQHSPTIVCKQVPTEGEHWEGGNAVANAVANTAALISVKMRFNLKPVQSASLSKARTQLMENGGL